MTEPGFHTSVLHPQETKKKRRKRELLEWGNAILVNSPRGRGRGVQGNVAGYAFLSSRSSSGSFIDPRGNRLEPFLSASTWKSCPNTWSLYIA